MSAHAPTPRGPVLLFCPGDRPERFGKAAAASDTVVLDLEDAVAPEHKRRARDEVVRAVRRLEPARTVVRVNGAGTPWYDDDVAALAEFRETPGTRPPGGPARPSMVPG
jgi:citrate lyase subunit beta/citryl-CoA lyase